MPTRGVLAALLVAVAFLAGAVGWALGSRDDAPGPGSADVRFLQDMIRHHEQAVELASLAVTAAPDVTVRKFAKEVITFQQYEIGLMVATLERWGHRPDADRATVMEWMGMPTPAEAMAGMASEEELAAYRRAEGRDLDLRFLRLMRAHHEGGVHMAEAAVERARDRSVRELARRMARNQRIEIEEYRRVEARLGAAG